MATPFVSFFVIPTEGAAPSAVPTVSETRLPFPSFLSPYLSPRLLGVLLEPFRHMKTFLRSLALTLLVFTSAFAQQTVDTQKLNSLFDVLESNRKMMGVITITKEGRPAYHRAFGYSRISDAEKIKNSDSTSFPIASLTKTFTTVMIFQLIEEKKLTLDTKLSKFFPRIANADKISIEQMLRHRSGIHNFSLDPDYAEWKTKPHTRSDILARYATYKSEFEPNEKEEYSNTPYVLLGYIIEDLTRSTYSEQLNNRIIGKLGLQKTFATTGNNTSGNLATSYTFGDSKWNPILKTTHPSNAAGAGGIFSTTADINRFMEALFDNKLISPQSLQTMSTPLVVTGNDSAMGTTRMVFNNKTKTAFTYDGSIDAYGSVYFYVPSDRLAVSMVTNGQNYPFGETLWTVIRILYGAPASIPSFTPITLPDETLSKYEGTYALPETELRMVVKKQDSKLVAQISGEPAMILQPTGETKFQYEPGGVLLDFQTNEAGKVDRVSIYKDRQKPVWIKQP